MNTRRWRAALALACYVGIGLGSPVADALTAHGSDAARPVHIEAAGEPGCHAADCVLQAPGTPQAPSLSPVGGPPVALPVVPVTAADLTSQHQDHPRVGPLGPRAPPVPD